MTVDVGLVIRAGVLETLNEAHSHLARASLVEARLQLERARAATQALALVGVPALVFADNGKILAANPLIETLSGFISWRAEDRIALKDARADALLRDAIATVDQDDSPSAPSTRPISSTNAALSPACRQPASLAAGTIVIPANDRNVQALSPALPHGLPERVTTTTRSITRRKFGIITAGTASGPNGLVRKIIAHLTHFDDANLRPFH